MLQNLGFCAVSPPQRQVANTSVCWERVKDLHGAAELGILVTKRHKPDTTCPEVWKHLEQGFGFGPV